MAFASLGIDSFTFGVCCLHIFGVVQERVGEVLELEFSVKLIEFLVNIGRDR